MLIIIPGNSKEEYEWNLERSAKGIHNWDKNIYLSQFAREGRFGFVEGRVIEAEIMPINPWNHNISRGVDLSLQRNQLQWPNFCKRGYSND